MSGTRYPLKDFLCDPVDEAAIHRIAEQIDARVRRPKGRRWRPLALIGVTAVSAIVAVASRIHRDDGPLIFDDGREFVAMDAGPTTKEIALSDGSHIRLSPGAHIEPLESSGTTFSAIVTQGHADFEVRPGGPRHWIIECGLATVEVTGTAFSCDREPGRLRLAVRHGAVLVRGERVPDRARRLSAGETLELTEESRPPAPVTPVTPVTDDAFAPSVWPALSPSLFATEPSASVAKVEEARPNQRISTTRSWRNLAGHGRYGEAFATLGTEGLRRESTRLGVSDLFALADVARLSGHPADAVGPLQRILANFADDAQAPLAAFALGRLEMDSLGQAHAATSAFRKALALGIPSGLREDVRARLVEAYARSGDAGAARRAADDYIDEFPRGRHLQAIRGWLDPK